MGWPTVAEFQVFLTAAGILAATPSDLQLLLDLDGALDAAVEEWNDRTRYWPFLSTGAVESRLFPPDPLRHYLDLNGGLLSLTRLVTDVSYTDSTGTVSSGTTVSQYINFRLCPRDAAARGRPYTYIEFLDHYASLRMSDVEVTGIWGYCLAASLPDSARRAVMALAAIELLPQVNAAATQGLIRWREGDVEKQFADSAKLASFWGMIADQAAARYRRTRVA